MLRHDINNALKDRYVSHRARVITPRRVGVAASRQLVVARPDERLR